MNKFYSFCYKFILAFGLIFLLFFGISNVFMHGHIDVVKERMLFVRNDVLFYILLAVFAFAIWKLKDVIGRIPAYKIFIVCSIIYLIVGLYICLNITDVLRADPYMIYKYSPRFLQGDYEGLTEKFYMRFFPYQLGMLTYEMGLLSIWHSTRIFFIGNLVFVLGINLIQWKATELLFEDNRISACCVLLSFGFLPLLFYILFAYGSTPGYFFVCLGFYFMIRYLRSSKISFAVLCGLNLGISIIFKPNYLIAVMAGVIVLGMEFIKKPAVKKAIIIVLVVALSILPNKAFLQMWREISGINFDGGAPYLLNVTMGMQPEEMGVGRLGGWYNGYNYDTFAENNCDVELTQQIAKDDLMKLIDYWLSGKDDPVKFFRDKLLSTWCDPLFQSLWSGPVESSNQFVEDRILHSLYDEDVLAIVAEKYMSVFMAIVYLLAALWCFRGIRKESSGTERLFNLLLFIGVLLFHLISETKSQYVYMFAYGIIPYAAGALFKDDSQSQ